MDKKWKKLKKREEELSPKIINIKFIFIWHITFFGSLLAFKVNFGWCFITNAGKKTAKAWSLVVSAPYRQSTSPSISFNSNKWRNFLKKKTGWLVTNHRHHHLPIHKYICTYSVFTLVTWIWQVVAIFVH